MQELLNNINSFWKSAEMVYKSKDYTSATILYFKCWFVILDFIIFNSKKVIPKDHNERFRILKDELPELYIGIDKAFDIYRDTYSMCIEKEKCDGIRKNVFKLIEKYKIQLNNK